MNDPYDETLAIDEQQRAQYWENIEEEYLEDEHSIFQLREKFQLGEF